MILKTKKSKGFIEIEADVRHVILNDPNKIGDMINNLCSVVNDLYEFIGIGIDEDGCNLMMQ